jgi:RHS repeat-associated protein
MVCRTPTNSAICNSTTQTGALLSYNNEGALKGWSQSGTNGAFLYQDGTQRVEQKTSSNITIYVGNLEELTFTNGTLVTTQAFYYANGTRFAVSSNGVISYLASDALGSSSETFSQAGAVTGAQLAKPYGSSRYVSGTIPTDYRFAGQHADAATGLDYFNSRYYDPQAGQFTSADSVLPGGGFDPLGLSPFAYVEGNPETSTDPSGHCSTEACLENLNGGPTGTPVGDEYGGNTAPATSSTPAGPWWAAALTAFANYAGSVHDLAQKGWNSGNPTLIGQAALEAAPAGLAAGLLAVGLVIVGGAALAAATSINVATVATGAMAIGATGQAILSGLSGDTGSGGATAGAAGDSALFRPGPFAEGSVPSGGPGSVSLAEQRGVNSLGGQFGCHSCGASEPGTPSGNWVGDHQPVSRWADGQPQDLYPQCLACSRQQGLDVINALRQGFNPYADWFGGEP